MADGLVKCEEHQHVAITGLDGLHRHQKYTISTIAASARSCMHVSYFMADGLVKCEKYQQVGITGLDGGVPQPDGLGVLM